MDPRLVEYFKRKSEGPYGTDPLAEAQFVKLAAQEEAMQDPGYRQSIASAQMGNQESANRQNLIAAALKASAQMGSLGGRVADTGAIDDVTGMNARAALTNNDAIRQQEQAKAQAVMSGQDKIREYLQKRRDLNTQAALEKQQFADKLAANKAAEDQQFARQKELENLKAGNERALLAQRSAGEEKLAKLRGEQQVQMAQAKASAPKAGGPLDKTAVRAKKEGDYRYVSLKNSANRLKDLVDRHGTFVPTGAAGTEMDSLIYQMAVDYAKMVDPESVAREGEVAAAQKYMLPFRENGGLTTRNSTAKQQIDNYLVSLDARMKARNAANEGNLDIATYEPSTEADEGTAIAAEPGVKVGDVVDGYKFLGGDPSDPKSWEEE